MQKVFGSILCFSAFALYSICSFGFATYNSEYTNLIKSISKYFLIAPYFSFDPEAVVNINTYNQDAKILQKYKEAVEEAQKKATSIPPLPNLEISGKVEGQGLFLVGESSFDLTAAELDLLGHINQWMLALIVLAHDSNELMSDHIGNSTIYLDRGFVTFGNLIYFPMYITLGKRYIPFGQYNSFSIYGPLTRSIGKADLGSVLIGYQHPDDSGVYQNVYIFKNIIHSGAHGVSIIPWGLALGYELKSKKVLLELGGDFISNIANAIDIQKTLNDNFTGFAADEELKWPVPGISLHSKWDLSKMTFIAEYVAAVKVFSPSNLSFNNHGARLGAYSMEAAYKFKMLNKRFSFALGYDKSFQALALNIPEQRYRATLNMKIWENTLTSIEIQRCIGYSASDTASGQGIVVASNAGITHVLILRFATYF